ncbi:unnamed protein product [Ectocarpus sp. 12 AP-2014]
MRAHTRVIAPALPLVYALRLSWAEPKALFSAARRIPAFSTAAAQTFTNLRDTGHSKPRSTWQFLPWAHALPLDVPAPSRKSPRVMDGMRKDVGKGFTLPGSLWQDCQLEAMRSLHHPWTLGLATGKTSLASFKNYVAQDAYFLRAFAKAYAYALAKAEDEEDIRAFHSLIGSVLEELGLHASYSAKWGIDVANTPPPVKATAEYVDFLMTVASDPTTSVAQVLAAMVPCMRLYAFLGQELRHIFPNWTESAYAEWIETYSSEDFEDAAGLVESLLDKNSAGADYPSLFALYRKAMELEFAFFDAQLDGGTEAAMLEQSVGAEAGGRQGTSVQPGGKDAGGRGRFHGVHERLALLCVDFDDTLTEGDTTSLLVETAKAQRETPEDRVDLGREWVLLTRTFLSKWSETIEDSLSTKLSTTACTANGSGAVDREGLELMLRKLEVVDLDSVSRVSDSKVLRGLTRDEVHSSLAGPLRSSWKVRPGMARCMSRALASPFQTHVVSINWSQDVISRVLSQTLLDSHSFSSSTTGIDAGGRVWAGETASPRLEGDCPASVSSNDLVFDEHGVSTGEIAVKIPGSFGKHQRFLDLAAMARESVASSESSPRLMTVYVGDSVTDLLAMLDADVGIVVGHSGSFEKVARAFGIDIRPLASVYEAMDGTGELPRRGAPSGSGQCVYRASQWAEIDVFLFGGE